MKLLLLKSLLFTIIYKRNILLFIVTFAKWASIVQILALVRYLLSNFIKNNAGLILYFNKNSSSAIMDRVMKKSQSRLVFGLQTSVANGND